jgi:ferritin
MAKAEVIQAFNDQIREELSSSYIYLGLSAELEALNLPGGAAWFRKQAQEEQTHAMKFYNFVHDVGGKVVLQALPEPTLGTKTLKDAFTKALTHEKHITGTIHNLVKLARKHDDLAAEGFLTWFVKEQIEEEKSVADILAKIELTGSASGGQYWVDKDLAVAAAAKD